MKRINLRYSLLVLALVAITLPAAANVLPPGGFVPPDVLSDVSNGYTILGDTGLKAYSTGDVVGHYEAFAVLMTNGVYGPNTINFFYYFTNENAPGGHVIQTASMSDFAGFQTDVGYDSVGASGVIPNFVSRSADGSVINFLYFAGVGGGANTWVLEIATDAHYYTSGTFALIDSGVVNLEGFAPGVPEPSSLLLLGSGLIGLGNVVRRKLVS